MLEDGLGSIVPGSIIEIGAVAKEAYEWNECEDRRGDDKEHDDDAARSSSLESFREVFEFNHRNHKLSSRAKSRIPW
jgi:hypothetical protein